MANQDERAGMVSSYLGYLPALFQADAASQGNFLGRFLLAFEHVLTGLGDPESPGLEEMLDGIAPSGGTASAGVPLSGLERYFDPGPYGAPRAGMQAPTEFLEWLSGWVALTVRADLDETRQREFIGRAVSLYQLRGTRQGIEETLRIYTRLGVTVDELMTPFQIGQASTLGEDTVIGGGAPHFFRVRIQVPAADPGKPLAEQLRRHREVATAIIDMEKPAHTWYTLEIETPTMQIGVHSTVGVDTLLG